jgi:hypothetical protein
LFNPPPQPFSFKGGKKSVNAVTSPGAIKPDAEQNPGGDLLSGV